MHGCGGGVVKVDALKIWERWGQGATGSSDYIGEAEPSTRVTIDPQWRLLPLAGNYNWPEEKKPVRLYQFSTGSINPELEIPQQALKLVSVEQSLSQDAATLSVDVINSGNFNEAGYLYFNHARSRMARQTWKQEVNEWQNVIVPGAMVRVYTGFGGKDKTIDTAVADGDLILYGTFILDTVSGRDIMTLSGRDMAALLIDQKLYPPLVPDQVYPLSYHTKEQLTSKTVYTNAPTSPYSDVKYWFNELDLRLGYATSSADVEYAEADKAIHGHRGSESVDGDMDTYAVSPGVDDPNAAYAINWWEYDIYTDGLYGDEAVTINDVKVATWGGPYTVYVSFMVGGEWVGDDTIPYNATGASVDTDADIKYVGKRTIPADQVSAIPVSGPLSGPLAQWHPFTVIPTKVRITVAGPLKTDLGPKFYRSGLREVGIHCKVAIDLKMREYINAHPYLLQSLTHQVSPESQSGSLYCADEETEILTRRGWLKWDEVEAGDETLALDRDTGKAEWSPITSVFRQHVEDEPMVRLESTKHSSLTTPNHSWLIYTGSHSKGDLTWKTTDGLNVNSIIPTAAPVSNLPVEKTYTDEFVELVAWFWTEGNYAKKGGASFTQSHRVNKANVDRIMAMLERGYGPAHTGDRIMPTRIAKYPGGNWSFYQGRNGVTKFQLGHVIRDELKKVVSTPEKIVAPEFLASLTESQLNLFIDVSIMADGHTHKVGTRVIGQISEARIRSFEMACALAGIATTTHRHTPVREGKELSPMWSTSLIRCPGATRPHAPETIGYTGVVWCPNVRRHHNWLARRNGTIYFTGNSDYTDIVKDLLLWSGFDHRASIASTTDPPIVHGNLEYSGAWAAEGPITQEFFDKKSPIDVIKQLRDILGFCTYAGREGEFHFHCVDGATEIFTKRGWLTHDQLRDDDIVFSYNTETGESEWVTVESVYRNEVRDVDLISMESDVHSSLTTTNHRWWTLPGEWSVSRDLDAPFPIAATCSDLPTDANVPDAQVRLAAQRYADGAPPSIGFLLQLTQGQLDLFIETLTSDGPFANDTLAPFEYACILAGVAPRTLAGVSRALTINQVSPPAKTIEPYTGTVWCPKLTKNFTWLARRDGTVYFTGNSPNYWQSGNFDDFGRHVDFIPDIRDDHLMMDWTPVYTKKLMRSQIIAASDDPALGLANTKAAIVGTEFLYPWLHQMVMPAMFQTPPKVSADEQEIMAELAALQIWFRSHTGKIKFLANPCIGVDDQIYVWERSTSEAYIHYISDISFRHDIQGGEYTMEASTFWLGDDEEWAITKDDIGSLTGGKMEVSDLLKQWIVDRMMRARLASFLQDTEFPIYDYGD